MYDTSQDAGKDQGGQKYSWITEKPIPQSRKDKLKELLAAAYDAGSPLERIRTGRYPFKGMKLTRADLEFLLSEQGDNGPGFVDWNDSQQRTRSGLDLRGANLREVNLSKLPLACIIAGLTEEEWFIATARQCQMAISSFEEADLSEAELQGATFCYANLARANLSKAHLTDADLFYANLREASFFKTDMAGANLYNTHLEGAKISKDELMKAKVDKHVLKSIVIERTVVPPWGTEENKIPFLPSSFYREYKSPRWLSGLLRTLLVPILIALVTILVTQAFDSISQKREIQQAAYAQQAQARQQTLNQQAQTRQQILDLKETIIIKMNNTAANALTELSLIQADEENKDITSTLKNYTDGYRNLMVNGSEIEAQLAAYFPQNQPCANMSSGMEKGMESYNNLVSAWDNYYRVVLDNFYDLDGTTDPVRRAYDIYWMKDVFTKYGIENYGFIVDQSSVVWDQMSKFSTIQKYNNVPDLVKTGYNTQQHIDYWTNLEQIIDGFKSIIGQCVLNSKIPILTNTP